MLTIKAMTVDNRDLDILADTDSRACNYKL